MSKSPGTVGRVQRGDRQGSHKDTHSVSPSPSPAVRNRDKTRPGTSPAERSPSPRKRSRSPIASGRDEKRRAGHDTRTRDATGIPTMHPSFDTVRKDEEAATSRGHPGSESDDASSSSETEQPLRARPIMRTLPPTSLTPYEKVERLNGLKQCIRSCDFREEMMWNYANELESSASYQDKEEELKVKVEGIRRERKQVLTRKKRKMAELVELEEKWKDDLKKVPEDPKNFLDAKGRWIYEKHRLLCDFFEEEKREFIKAIQEENSQRGANTPRPNRDTRSNESNESEECKFDKIVGGYAREMRQEVAELREEYKRLGIDPDLESAPNMRVTQLTDDDDLFCLGMG